MSRVIDNNAELTCDKAFFDEYGILFINIGVRVLLTVCFNNDQETLVLDENTNRYGICGTLVLCFSAIFYGQRRDGLTIEIPNCHIIEFPQYLSKCSRANMYICIYDSVYSHSSMLN